MALRSFRQAASSVQLNDFSTGILASSLNPFYTENNGANRAYFPYLEDGAISLRQMMDAWRWPSSYSQVSTYPDSADDPNWSDEAQGLAVTDNGQWVFTSNDNIEHPRIWRVPVTHDLDQTVSPNPDVNYAGIPARYRIGKHNHMGACSVHGNIAYVPVEYAVEENRVVRFGVGTSSINFLDGAYIRQNPGKETGASCVVINTRNKTMMVSAFETLKQTHELSVYSVNGQTGINRAWPFLGYFPLFDSDGSELVLCRVQGGCIAPSGHLYLVEDTKKSQGGGFYGFDLITGRLVCHKQVDYSTQPCEGGDLLSFELEDIVVKDFTNTPHHSTIAGEIHVLGLDNDLFESDNISILHFEVPLGEELWI